ncbi:MAG: UbiA family prenyltransferase [Planctomycetota bacterium]
MNARAWLEISRGSNLPTVWSNVLHGLAAGVFVTTHTRFGDLARAEMPREPFWFFNQGFMLLVGISLVYLAGMMLNDAFDARQDATERPDRPIPSGRISRRSAWAAGFATLGLGVAASLVFREPAVPITVGVLAFCIVAYNATHRVAWLGVPLMAACRGLAVVAAAAAFAPPQRGAWVWAVGLPALAIAVYTAIVALIARGEAEEDARVRPAHVGLLLAAMPALDAVLLARLGQWPLAGTCLALAGLTVFLQRLVRGS